jgi:ribosomal protein S18 acetylase RimI-like enzyme
MPSLASQSQPLSETSIRLLAASQFTIEELTEAYNQTRIDYMVPMPMNAARLAAYVKTYDVDMDRSYVALDSDGMILGLAMLGVRPGRTWITRLGVLPNRRRRGTGETLVQALMEGTRALRRPLSILEVIKGNFPAHQLFLKAGFYDTRELLILRRPPGLPQIEPAGRAHWMERDESLDLLCCHPTRPAWTNEMETYINAADTQGIEVDLGAAGRGWMTFRRQKFLLSHFVLYTETGSPDAVASALIAHLYSRYHHIDTYIENLPIDDPHLPVLMRNGFLEVFRRVEMYWENSQVAG